MADTLESLAIEVLHNANGAANSINEITSSIRQMGNALSDVLPQLKGYSDAIKSIGKVKATGNNWGEQVQEALETNDKGIGANLQEVLDQEDVSFLSSLLNTIKEDFSGIWRAASRGLSSIPSKLSAVSKAAKSASQSVNSLAKASNKSSGALGKLAKSIGRIAFYRAIRSAIKAVTQAFQEGFEAAYTFSSGIAGEGNRFAKAVDNVRAAGNAMKGQLGSAFISLYAAVAPVIIAIINLITRLADAMSQLFSAFTGKTYLKAQVNAAGLADSMAGGAKAAKEWRNQLMGFDEINKLEAPGDGGGGGGGAAGSPFSFEDTPLDDWAMKIHDSLAAIELAAAGFALALGLILTLSGANIPLGLALIAVGVAGMIHALKEDWSTVDQSVARVLSAIMLTLGGAMLAVGALLAFSGANVPLGIGLMAAGAVSIATGVMIDWKALPHNVKTVLSDIMLAVGGALLALGLIITFATPSFSPLGLGLIIAGAASLAAAAAINWDWLSEMMHGKLGVITAIAGGALLALGLILTLCCPAALPLGIGLMIAGGLALGSVVAINWDAISSKIRSILNNILSIFTGFANTVKNIINGIINFIQNLLSAISRAISSIFSLRGASASIGVSVRGYASGGFPEDGLFFANHNELVGQFSNGKTAVANNQEIVEGIKQGVIDAMLTVGSSQGGGKNTEFVFQLNGKEFARAIYNDQRTVARERGMSLVTKA